MKNFGLFLYCFVPVAVAMALGSYFNNEAIDGWYQVLQKPVLTPPDYVFPIVWNIIYLMIIITFFIAFKSLTDGKDILTAKKYFFGQLILHVLWTFSFFYLGQAALGILIIILLDSTVLYNIFWFWNKKRICAWLLIPYYCWLLLATWLNIGYVYLHGYVINN